MGKPTFDLCNSENDDDLDADTSTMVEVIRLSYKAFLMKRFLDLQRSQEGICT
jgi:hypothetical protein